MKIKQRIPVAVCTQCGKYSTNGNVINEPCGNQTHNGKRCRGVFGSAINVGDWQECPSCLAVGRVDSSCCSQCDGHGWLYMRGKRRD